MKRFLTIFLAVVVIMAAFFVIRAYAPSTPGEENMTGPDAMTTQTEEGLSVGKKLPDFMIGLMDGSAVKISDYQGKVVYLNFWATWCGPCVAEMPDMQEVYEEYGDEIAMLAVNVDGEDDAVVSDFFKENGFTFPVGIDKSRSLGAKYEVAFIPTTFVLTPDGTISSVFNKMLSKDKMKAAIEKAKGQ